MKYIGPNKVTWRKDPTTGITDQYGQTSAKRILKTETHSSRDGITSNITALTPALLEWFTPLYTNTISQKNSPVIFDIEQTTKNTDQKTYHILTISEQGKQLGGLIFSITEESINIAYKIFTNQWIYSKLPAGPSLYADYLITKHAADLRKKYISHGKDRNGYGKHSSIGLALFKIALGYKPYLPKDFEALEFTESEIDGDSLYFVTNESISMPLHGHLFTREATRQQWARFKSYTDRVSVTWHIID
ncbi:MAG: hypothetical protein ACK4SL_00920 [Candidatus Paceibacteria bacterium]